MRWTIVTCLVWSTVAAADPPTVSPVSADQLPEGVTARGDKLQWAMTFVDKNGANYVLVSTHEDTKNVNGKKYIFRGTTRVKAGLHGETAGGDFTPDPVEAKWPPAFFAHVKETWAKTVNAAE